MSRRSAWIICTLLLGGPGLSRSARAEAETNPLAEMRVAAEALADTEPESGSHRLNAAVLPNVLKPASATERKSILHEAVRETVRSEIARERATLLRPTAGRGASAARADRPADGNGGASGQAHSAAAQAQQAKRSNEVSLQHRQNFINASQPSAPGQDHAPGRGLHPKP